MTYLKFTIMSLLSVTCCQRFSLIVFSFLTICLSPSYEQYYVNHPSNTAKDGSAIFIKANIRHNQNKSTMRSDLHVTSLDVPTSGGIIKIASLYLPPNKRWTKNDFDQLLITLGPKYLAGGDYNAKHQWWGNLRACSRGKRLQEAIITTSIEVLAKG